MKYFKKLIVILFVSCSETKDVSVIEKPDYPNLILERPINSDYYIGIANNKINSKDVKVILRN